MKTLNLNKNALQLNWGKGSSKKIIAGIGLSLALHSGMFGQASNCANACGLTGSDNAAFGNNTMGPNIGNFNSAFGRWSLVSLYNGIENSAYGGSTLGYNSSGNRNTGIGYAALGNNQTANDNTAVGNRAAMNITTGYQNTVLGTSALFTNQLGIGSLAVGYQALYSDTYNNGSHPNHAVGFQSMFSNTSGAQNTAEGYQTLYSNTTANNNSAFGIYTLRANATGDDNTGAGCVALSNNTSGGGNTAFGTLALDGNTTGSGNTGLGRGANVGSGNLTNATAVGCAAVVNATNKVRIGDANVTVIEGQVNWSWPSDQRFKSNITETDVKGLDFIKLLRPVVYNFDTRKFQEFLTKNLPDSVRKLYTAQSFDASTAIRHSGFIAQEVEKAADAVGYNFDGLHKPANDNDNYSLGYSQFVVPLVKAVQEQQKMIEDLQKTIEDQNKKLAISTGISQSDLSNSGFNMEQNQPNPFTHETVVKYTLPAQIGSAYMGVYDLSGKQIATLPINTKENSVTITSEKLAAGIYIYTIVADGKAMDSKKMIVAEK